MVSGTVCGGSIPLRRTKKKSTLSVCMGRDFLCPDIIDWFYTPVYSLLPKRMLKLISATTAVGGCPPRGALRLSYCKNPYPYGNLQERGWRR